MDPKKSGIRKFYATWRLSPGNCTDEKALKNQSLQFVYQKRPKTQQKAHLKGLHIIDTSIFFTFGAFEGDDFILPLAVFAFGSVSSTMPPIPIKGVSSSTLSPKNFLGILWLHSPLMPPSTKEIGAFSKDHGCSGVMLGLPLNSHDCWRYDISTWFLVAWDVSSHFFPVLLAPSRNGVLTVNLMWFGHVWSNLYIIDAEMSR